MWSKKIQNSKLKTHNFSFHWPLLLVLLLHLTLSLTYSVVTPLGETPDEPAHLRYVQFIAKQGGLPTTLAQRQEAGYRSSWPPLYHFMAAGPLAIIGDAPPTRLKSVGDTPRRLIPTNGQTIAAFIHTADEAWPWRGLTLAWHLGRLISVTLTALTVMVTYAIAWRLTGRRRLALSTAALHASIPQILFIGSALNDDNLLILLSGLIFLSLIVYTQQSAPPNLFQACFLGVLLGLASVAKYNALPLWGLVPLWLGWLIVRPHLRRPTSTDTPPTVSPRPAVRSVGKLLAILLTRLVALLLGIIVTAGWWFIFVWYHFNQVNSLGPFQGSLAALAAGSSGLSGSMIRQLGSGLAISLPAPTLWLEWFTTLFKSFWGLFGGGGSIELARWIYWLLAIVCVISVSTSIGHWASNIKPHGVKFSTAATFLVLFPLFFLILPLLRFLMSGGNIIETAQGRHLFPALPALTFNLVWGLSRLSQSALPSPLSALRSPLHASRFTLQPSFFILLTVALNLHSLTRIHPSYPPPIPLHTTPDAAAVEHRLDLRLTESITLLGYELSQAGEGMLPITLVWQADAVPAQDYLIDLSLTDPAGQPLGGWLGHPVGGRYPTRAWDEDDILRDTIPIALIPGLSPTTATLTLKLLDSTNQLTNQPSNDPTTLIPNLPIFQSPNLPTLPAQLRADGLTPNAPFTYRSTLSLALPETATPELIAPSGQAFTPAKILSAAGGSIAHFIVGPNWPSGNYQLSTPALRLRDRAGASVNNEQLSIPISNRVRQFNLPPMEHTLNANFADTITILGYDLSQRRVQPGDSFPITLHLRAERTLGQNLVIFNHLLDHTATQRGGVDRIPQNYYTTLLWVPGEIVSDAYDVPIEPTAPPGVYWLDVGFYPANQPTRSLPLFVDGQPIDRTGIRLGPIKVGGPPPDVTVPKASPQHPLGITFGSQGQITLLGFNLTANGEIISTENAVKDRKSETPALTLGSGASVVNLKLYWQPTAILPADYTVFVHLLDPAGNLIAQADSPPAAGAYPTSLWDPGEIIADEHTIPDLPPGHYVLQVGLYRPDTGERLPAAESADGAVRLIEFEVGE